MTRTCSVSAHTRTLPERRPSVQLAMTERLRREVSIIQAIAQVEAAVFVWGSIPDEVPAIVGMH